jgi:hypothetical protein
LVERFFNGLPPACVMLTTLLAIVACIAIGCA